MLGQPLLVRRTGFYKHSNCCPNLTLIAGQREKAYHAWKIKAKGIKSRPILFIILYTAREMCCQ